MAELLRSNKVIVFEEVAVCWMINTVARECWVATDIYCGLFSSAKSWAWQKKCRPS